MSTKNSRWCFRGDFPVLDYRATIGTRQIENDGFRRINAIERRRGGKGTFNGNGGGQKGKLLPLVLLGKNERINHFGDITHFVDFIKFPAGYFGDHEFFEVGIRNGGFFD